MGARSFNDEIAQVISRDCANRYFAPNISILLFIDFERPFGSVEWPLLISALKKFNFWEHFIKWIKMLHSKPKKNMYKEQLLPFALTNLVSGKSVHLK